MELYRDDKRQCSNCPLIKGIRLGETAVIEVNGCFGGKAFQIFNTGMLYRDKPAVLEIFQDITERRQAEETLKKANEELKKLDQLKSDFVSIVSHELKTPLGPIKEGVSIVLDGLAGEINKEQKDMLDMVKKNADRLGRLVSNVLDFQKLQVGGIKFDARENNINDAIREIYQTMVLMTKEKALDFQLELEEGIPFASLIQVKTAAITERLKSRHRMINIFVFLQAIMLLPMALIAFKGEVHPIVFIITVVFFTSFGAIDVPAWGSLMSDMIAKEERGAYFGWRNRTLGFITVGAAFAAGIILNLMKKIDVFHGFVIVFISASVFRLISWYFLKNMHEAPLEYKKENCFSFVDFISKIRTSNFARFVLFISMMSFSVNLGSPFFS